MKLTLKATIKKNATISVRQGPAAKAHPEVLVYIAEHMVEMIEYAERGELSTFLDEIPNCTYMVDADFDDPRTIASIDGWGLIWRPANDASPIYKWEKDSEDREFSRDLYQRLLGPAIKDDVTVAYCHECGAEIGEDDPCFTDDDKPLCTKCHRKQTSLEPYNDSDKDILRGMGIKGKLRFKISV
jgi:hypothetical protein